MKALNCTTTLFVLLTVLSMLVTQSCKKDKCEAVSCFNGSYCDNGTCNCPVGYSGDSCQTMWRDAYLGTWDVVDSCQLSAFLYQVDFAGSDTAINKLVMVVYQNGFFIPLWGAVFKCRILDETHFELVPLANVSCILLTIATTGYA